MLSQYFVFLSFKLRSDALISIEIFLYKNSLQIRDTDLGPNDEIKKFSKNKLTGLTDCRSSSSKKRRVMSLLLNKKYQLISVSVVIGLLSGCLKIQKKDSKEPALPVVASAPATPSVTRTEPALAEPVVDIKKSPALRKRTTVFQYHYESTASEKNTQQNDDHLDHVQFEFPINTPEQLLVEKTMLDGQKSGSEFFITLDEEGRWNDVIISQNKVNYKFYKKDQDGQKLLNEVEVLPVLNMNLSQDLNLMAEYQINSKTKLIYFKSLEMTSEAHLFIQDFSGNIIIENLVSSEGTLQTFPIGQRADFGKNGRSVGNFSVNVLNGSGRLNILAVAESGGDGLPGRDPDETLRGKPGGIGTPAHFISSGTTNCGGVSGLCIRNDLYECRQPGSPGGNGGAGLRGYPGKDAGDAGDIGLIKMNSEVAQVDFKFISRTGQKGLGGPGGAGGFGGSGGPGGDGGVRDFIRERGGDPDNVKDQVKNLFAVQLSKACEPALPGATGPRGETGASGHDGRDGAFSPPEQTIEGKIVPLLN